MKNLISRKNVSLFIKGRFGITLDELFEAKKMNPEFFQGVMEDVFEEFTNGIPSRKEKFLETFNPYTQKMETFGNTRGRLIGSMDELMENLSDVHRERMSHLNRSFYQELGIQKKEQVQKRSKEIETLSKEGNDELER